MVMDVNKLFFISKCVLINEENKFLILKRTDYKNNNTGDLWDIPGGSVDLDEEVNLAVRREVKEELQVELNEASVFHIDSGKGMPSGKEVESSQFVFVLFVSKHFNLGSGIKLSDEHSEYKWISVNEIDNYQFYLRNNRIDAIKKYLKRLK